MLVNKLLMYLYVGIINSSFSFTELKSDKAKLAGGKGVKMSITRLGRVRS